jgi:hypothetical protein
VATQYEFVFRFRQQQEPEGCGSMLFRLVSTASLISVTVRQIHHVLMQRDPTIQFDGMTLCACEEA